MGRAPRIAASNRWNNIPSICARTHIIIQGNLCGLCKQSRGGHVFSRVNFLDAAPDRIGDVARVVREVVHPAISAEPGYVGYLVLGNRDTGHALGVTLWDSERDRETSDARARQIRPVVEAETGGVMRAVEQYDLLFVDLRPEISDGT